MTFCCMVSMLMPLLVVLVLRLPRTCNLFRAHTIYTIYTDYIIDINIIISFMFGMCMTPPYHKI